MTLSQGDRLGRYEVLGPIGAGGMGEVWRARDTELDRQVAVKVLPEEVASEPRRVERFRREARALAALSHPNLLEIHDVGSSNALHYVVTELLEGDSLRAAIPPSGLPWKKVAEIGAAAADGLAAAHGKGIVHRDLKPENLFLTTDGRVKILDFGLATMDNEFGVDGNSPTVTEDGAVLGTTGYMAPEQLRGRSASAQSDIFSLGCVLYEVASGRRAFTGNTGAEVIAAILKEEPPQLSSSGSAVPVDLERSVHRCLEKRPEARFQSAADLAYSLRNLGSSPSAPVMATPDATVSSGGRPWLRWQLAVAAILVTAAAMVAWRSVAPPAATPEAPATIVELESNRIAIVPLVNRSDDPSLDALGRLCAEKIVSELAEIEELEVVATDELASMVKARSSGHEELRPLIGDVASATSARMVLTGALYESGDEIALHATLNDAASGQVIRDFDSLTSPRTTVDEMLATLSGWVFIATMETLHPSLRFGASDRLPDPEAFREYLAGLRTAGVGGSDPSHILRAMELDPEFHGVRFWGVFAAWSGSMWSLADAILRTLEEVRPELSPSQQRLVDAGRWGHQGRWFGALGILKEYSANHPDDCMARACVIKTALWANQPRLALEAFRLYRWDPVQSSNQHKIVSFNAAVAHHLLGQYEKELAVLRRLWVEQPAFFGTTWFRGNEARALAALGRIEECRLVIAEAMTEPTYGPERYGGLLVGTAAELRVHGHGEESRAMAERSLEWFEQTELPPQSEIGALESSIEALGLLGRHREAYELTRVLLAAKPDRWQSQARVGVAAARTGDEAVAREISGQLAALDEPFTFGMPRYYRAAIATQLGDRSEAIRLLQQAVTRGFRGWSLLHVEMAFDPIRDDPDFQEIVRPKG